MPLAGNHRGNRHPPTVTQRASSQNKPGVSTPLSCIGRPHHRARRGLQLLSVNTRFHLRGVVGRVLLLAALFGTTAKAKKYARTLRSKLHPDGRFFDVEHDSLERNPLATAQMTAALHPIHARLKTILDRDDVVETQR